MDLIIYLFDNNKHIILYTEYDQNSIKINFKGVLSQSNSIFQIVR